MYMVVLGEKEITWLAQYECGRWAFSGSIRGCDKSIDCAHAVQELCLLLHVDNCSGCSGQLPGRLARQVCCRCCCCCEFRCKSVGVHEEVQLPDVLMTVPRGKSVAQACTGAGL